MSYVALYRKWRPTTFDDVVEQSVIVETLKNTVKSGRIAHAYLFCGTRGTGKTTLAKIFARAINCDNPQDGNPCNECEKCKEALNGTMPDILELDAASKSRVDDIRQLCEESTYQAAVGAYRVYIIDEVHMLSISAFNALLKTLEEPSPGTVFILATTDPQKLPATILSRCQRFDFSRITNESISAHLLKIADDCNVKLEKPAADLIAHLAEGGLRDAISILDQCISTGLTDIDVAAVRTNIGIPDLDNLVNCGDALVNNNVNQLLGVMNNVRTKGMDLYRYCTSLMEHLHCLLILKVAPETAHTNDIYGSNAPQIEKQAQALSVDKLVYLIRELAKTEELLAHTSQPFILLETTLIRLCMYLPSYSEPTAEKVNALEESLALLKEDVGQLEHTGQIGQVGQAVHVRQIGQVGQAVHVEEATNAAQEEATHAAQSVNAAISAQSQQDIPSTQTEFVSSSKSELAPESAVESAGGSTRDSNGESTARVTNDANEANEANKANKANKKDIVVKKISVERVQQYLMKELKALGVFTFIGNCDCFLIGETSIGYLPVKGDATANKKFLSSPEELPKLQEAVDHVYGNAYRVRILQSLNDLPQLPKRTKKQEQGQGQAQTQAQNQQPLVNTAPQPQADVQMPVADAHVADVPVADVPIAEQAPWEAAPMPTDDDFAETVDFDSADISLEERVRMDADSKGISFDVDDD